MKLVEVAKRFYLYQDHFEVVWSVLDWWILLHGYEGEMWGWMDLPAWLSSVAWYTKIMPGKNSVNIWDFWENGIQPQNWLCTLILDLGV